MKRNELKGNVEVRARFIGARSTIRNRYKAIMRKFGLRRRTAMAYISDMTLDQVEQLCDEIAAFIAANKTAFAVDVLDVTFNGAVICSVERDELIALAA